jgi:hypothetical protein
MKQTPCLRLLGKLPLCDLLKNIFLPHVHHLSAGVYILENHYPLGGRKKPSADVIWGKYMKSSKRKKGKCEEKRDKTEERQEN